jgi:hypothetical protein
VPSHAMPEQHRERNNLCHINLPAIVVIWVKSGANYQLDLKPKMFAIFSHGRSRLSFSRVGKTLDISQELIVSPADYKP